MTRSELIKELERIPKFRVRCSAINRIMGGSFGITDKQEEKLQYYYQKEKDKESNVEALKKELEELKATELAFPPDLPDNATDKAAAAHGKKIIGIKERHAKAIDKLQSKLDATIEKPALTENQAIEKADLEYKKNPDNWQLPEGAKTYCKEWFKQQRYFRSKQFTGQKTDKGLIVEDEAIDYIADVLALGFAAKNEEWLSNKYIHGTPDLRLLKLTIDNKSSWDCFTFPLFADHSDVKNEYFAQAQGYMKLCGVDRYWLVYTLMDMPENMLEREITRESYKFGNEDKTEAELREIVEARYLYSGLADHLRIRVFDLEYDPEYMAEVEMRVKMCQDYVEDVLIPQEIQRFDELERYKKVFEIAA